MNEKRGAVPSMTQPSQIHYIDEDPPQHQNQTASFGVKARPKTASGMPGAKRTSTLMKPTKASLAKNKFQS